MGAYSPELKGKLVQLGKEKWPTPVQGLAHAAREWLRNPLVGLSISSEGEKAAAEFLVFCQNLLLEMGLETAQLVENRQIEPEVGLNFANAMSYFSRGAGPLAATLWRGELVVEGISWDEERSRRARALAAAGMVHLVMEQAIRERAVGEDEVPGGWPDAWLTLQIILQSEIVEILKIFGAPDGGEEEPVPA